MSSVSTSSKELALIDEIVSAIPDATAVFDDNYLLVSANKAFLDLWRFTSYDQALDYKFVALWSDPNDRDMVHKSLHLGGTWSRELLGQCLDGQTIDVHVSSRIVRESEELPAYSFLSFVDVSAHNEVVNALIESQQRFRDVTETISDLIYELDESGSITYMSHEEQDMVGPAMGLRVGENYFDLVEGFLAKGGEQTPSPTGTSIGAFKNHEPFADFRTEFINPDGKRFVWLRSGVPKFDSNNEFRGYRVAQKDITNITHREEALIHSEMRIQGIMDNVAVGIATVDEKGKIESFNSEAERIFGCSEKEACGQDLTMLMPLNVRKQEMTNFNQYLQTGESVFIGRGAQERTGLRPDGSTFPMTISISEMDINGRRTFIGSFLDISEKKEAERIFQQVQKMDAVGQMTGGIAHDFNNLLGALALNLEMLSSEPEGTKQIEELFDVLSSTIDRGAALTKRLLTFSRQQVLETAPVEVNNLVEELTTLLTRTFPAPINIKTKLDPDCWKANADPHQLENALLNLCINARDAMAEGGNLTLTTSNYSLLKTKAMSGEDMAAGDYILISVSDTGTGISDEIIDHIFEPFYTTKEVGKGTGLGLSMVYGFVRQSGGHLNVTSLIGSGTLVELYFPRSTSSEERPSHPSAAIATAALEGLEVLIVEDDPDIQKVLLKALERKGCKVETTASGPEAMDWLANKSSCPDLLITDIVLPGGMNGVDISNRVKDTCPSCQTIFMSGYLGDEIPDYAAVTNQSNFLSKPFTLSQLLDLINQVLAKSQAA